MSRRGPALVARTPGSDGPDAIADTGAVSIQPTAAWYRRGIPTGAEP